MDNVRVVTDLEECRRVWLQLVPEDHVSDLWEFRACFQRHYQRPARFIVAEEKGRICGLLPLSWIEEAGYFGYFPGEVWHGKTWLEQNRVIARDAAVFKRLLNLADGNGNGSRTSYYLRYLLPAGTLPAESQTLDEIGYLFNPPDFNFDMENYFQLFSHKSAKRIKREVAAFEERGMDVRLDNMADFDLLVRLSLGRYDRHSYFNDARFTEGFRDVMRFLADRGWLRLTAILIEGEPAAVDMGCVYHGVYTLLGGGTSDRFPGIAKLINLYHMRRACNERLSQVDFLCGDFSWKTMFHLTPRPLYLLSNMDQAPVPDAATALPQSAAAAPIVIARGANV